MSQEREISNKIALVTGASRGIGKAIVMALAKNGAFVIGTEIFQEGADAITGFLKEAGLKGCGKVLDITKSDDVIALISEIKSDHGPVEILVNNAGITRDNLALRMKDDEWDSVINTNLTAGFKLSRLCLRDMIKGRYGRIINISSISGVTGNPGQVNYVAAKAGLIGVTKTLAIEIASRGITVNAVAPGFIKTAMTDKLNDQQKEAILKTVPMGKIGEPEDVANVVAFLALSQARYITGQTIHVNGGMYMAS